jgi:hypothetical protein
MLLAAAAAASTAGCSDGRGEPLTVAVEAPHKGNVFPIPGGKGNVEILVDSKRESRKADTTILAYFYDASMTPISPAPSDAVILVKDAGVEKSIPLRAKVGQEAGQLSSDPGPFREGLTGDVSATIGGEAVKAPFSIR